MIGHFVGSSYPTNYFNSPSSGVSFSVWQFFLIATNAVPVHKPDNGFRTVQLVGEERYCLGCMAIRWMDVVYGEVASSRCQVSSVRIARCRVCEKVGAV